MALTYKGKIVTTAEYNRIKKKEGKGSKVSNTSLVKKRCYWFGNKDEGFPLWEGVIVSEAGLGNVTIKALNRNLNINPEQKEVTVVKNIDSIHLEKK